MAPRHLSEREESEQTLLNLEQTMGKSLGLTLVRSSLSLGEHLDDQVTDQQSLPIDADQSGHNVRLSKLHGQRQILNTF